MIIFGPLWLIILIVVFFINPGAFIKLLLITIVIVLIIAVFIGIIDKSIEKDYKNKCENNPTLEPIIITEEVDWYGGGLEELEKLTYHKYPVDIKLYEAFFSNEECQDGVKPIVLNFGIENYKKKKKVYPIKVYNNVDNEVAYWNDGDGRTTYYIPKEATEVYIKYDTVTMFIIKLNYQNDAQTTSQLQIGDTVKVLNAIQYDNGKSFEVWHSTYVVTQISGDRVVISKDGITIAAVHKDNLARCFDIAQDDC